MKNLFLPAVCLLTVLLLPSCSTTDDVIGSGIADPPCSDGSGNRFVDCGNGTVTDTSTGLVWLKSANCFGETSWSSAKSSVAGLAHGQCGLTDNSSAGDWSLPSLLCSSGSACGLEGATGEFSGIFAPGCSAPYIKNTAGTGCWTESNPFSGVQSNIYWSATSHPTIPSSKWTAHLGGDYVQGSYSGNSYHAWPVRGGQ